MCVEVRGVCVGIFDLPTDGPVISAAFRCCMAVEVFWSRGVLLSVARPNVGVCIVPGHGRGTVLDLVRQVRDNTCRLIAARDQPLDQWIGRDELSGQSVVTALDQCTNHVDQTSRQSRVISTSLGMAPKKHSGKSKHRTSVRNSVPGPREVDKKMCAIRRAAAVDGDSQIKSPETRVLSILFLSRDCAALIDHQVFQDDKPPVVGVTPLEDGEPGVLFNRVKTASKKRRRVTSCCAGATIYSLLRGGLAKARCCNIDCFRECYWSETGATWRGRSAAWTCHETSYHS